MTDSVHFSSKTDQHATPIDLFHKLDSIFHFETDVCADKHNSKCVDFITEEQDSLKQEWRGVCWMNPPYGRSGKGKTSILDWMKKAYESSISNGATVVCLVPARVDTA